MKQRILIIEDDADLLGILERWLRNAGYESVRSVMTGRGARDALEQPWDLIISDVCLPDMDGIEIARLIREEDPNCRVLLMTGHLTTEVTLRAIDNKVDAFLAKPINPQEFLEKVQTLLQVQKTQRPAQRVLAIGAHPDDVEIGCGGILLRHRDAGDTLCILTLSNGACGGPTGIRSEEAREASELLGAKLILENLKDTQISEGPETIAVINRAINQFQPTVVYTHSVHDAHQDHRNTHHATVVACRGIPTLESYQSPSSTIGFTPSRFVDISKELLEKQALLACYRSQQQKCRYLKNSLIESTAEYWGRFAGYSKVEPLEVLRSAL